MGGTEGAEGREGGVKMMQYNILVCNLQNYVKKDSHKLLGVVAHTFNLSPQEIEVGGSLGAGELYGDKKKETETSEISFSLILLKKPESLNR